MADVIFYDEEDSAPVRKAAVKKQSLLSRLVIQTGLAKSVAQAEQVMLIIAIIALIAAVGIALYGSNPPGSGTSPQALQAANAKLQLEALQAQQASQQAH